MRTVPGRVFVKICGITSAEDARAAVEAGADALGFVFWPGSPRFVTPEAAAAIAATVPPFVTRVGVFVGGSRDELLRTAETAGLDVLQLHGDISESGGVGRAKDGSRLSDISGEETAKALVALPRRALKVLRIGPGFRADDVLPYARAGLGLLVDTHRPEAPGGTGAAFDWTLVQGLSDRVPFLVLAGGLRPDTVAQAIDIVRPHAVDVSSGVESSPGRKDEDKLRAFVAAVHAATSREPSLWRAGP